MKKFVLTNESKSTPCGRTIYRIQACTTFLLVNGHEVSAGDIGGFVEKESNLSQEGACWVSDDARVSGNR